MKSMLLGAAVAAAVFFTINTHVYAQMPKFVPGQNGQMLQFPKHAQGEIPQVVMNVEGPPNGFFRVETTTSSGKHGLIWVSTGFVQQFNAEGKAQVVHFKAEAQLQFFRFRMVPAPSGSGDSVQKQDQDDAETTATPDEDSSDVDFDDGE